MNIDENAEKDDCEGDIFFEIPVITTSSPVNSDSDASPVYVNITKRSFDHAFHSDEEADTSFMHNNNTLNSRASILQSLSPGNSNASGVSRGNVRRWSQSLTNASKGRQNRTINILPSRLQKPLSMDGQLHRIVDSDFEFEHFVQEIEQYDYLMEDSATAAQKRNKILRALPQSLHIKRQIKCKVMEIVKEKSRRMGTNRWKRGLYFFGMCKTKSTLMVHNFMRNLQLWNDSMKEIEGRFGAGAETYFQLFHFLFFINILIMIIAFTFIVLPQLLNDYFQESASNVSRSHLLSIDKLDEEINILDFFTGEGSFENSTLFYGAYTDQKIEFWGSTTTYSLPFAYLMTMFAFYAVTYIVFAITTAESYRKSFIATSGGQALRAHKLFCSWDFGISNQRAADIKHQNIYLELKSIVNQLYENVCFLSIWQKICGYIISAVIWIFVVAVLIIIGCSIVFATDILKQIDKGEKLSAYLKESSLIVPTIVVLGLLLCQYLFEFLGCLETKIVKMYRSPRSQLHIALIRNYLFNIVTITSLVWFLLPQTLSETPNCWETWIAQNIYRLIIVEFFFITCFGTICRFIRFAIYKYLWTKIGISEFNISRGCLGLIFNQTLLWIGIFFSPPLAAIIVLKMIATFYLKKMVLIHCCRPPSKLWRSSQTYTLFLSMLFVSLTIVVVILLYVLTQIPVSKTCGPFRNHMYMFHVLREDILKLQENHFLWQLIMFLVRPAAIGLLLLTLCVLVYYLRSKSKARIEMVKLLKQMLYIEAKDKEFLLANITRVTQNNEWLLDDSVRAKPLLVPSIRNMNKYSKKAFSGNSNGKFAHLIFDENSGKFRKKTALNFTRNGRSANGRSANGRSANGNEDVENHKSNNFNL